MCLNLQCSPSVIFTKLYIYNYDLCLISEELDLEWKAGTSSAGDDEQRIAAWATRANSSRKKQVTRYL